MTTTSALQYLRMDKVDLQSWSQAFANMAEVKYLREVYLEQCTNPAFHGLHLLFTESHSLQTFHLYESRPGNPSMAVLLEALFSKQSIELHISSGASNDDIIDAAGWSDPIVEKLHITMSAMLTIRTLRMLTRLSQLKDPTLDSEYISQNDIYAYLQTRRLPTRVMLKAGKSEDGSITEVTVFLSFIHCVFHCPLHEGWFWCLRRNSKTDKPFSVRICAWSTFRYFLLNSLFSFVWIATVPQESLSSNHLSRKDIVLTRPTVIGWLSVRLTGSFLTDRWDLDQTPTPKSLRCVFCDKVITIWELPIFYLSWHCENIRRNN